MFPQPWPTIEDPQSPAQPEEIPEAQPENLRAKVNLFQEGNGEKQVSLEKQQKWNWCHYCNTKQTKLLRHMSTKHRDSDEVKKYLDITDPDVKVQAAKRKTVGRFIINLSNNMYNKTVVNNPETDINPIVVKKGKTEMTNTSHVLCSNCGGLMSKKNISAHLKQCKNTTLLLGKESGTKVPKSTMLCPNLGDRYSTLKQFILDNQLKDEVSYTCQTDPVILEYGRKFFKRHRAVHQRNFTSSQMRNLADLLIRMKKEDPENVLSFSDVLLPQNFNTLIDVVNKWSKYDDQTGICTVASVPRRLCKPLKKCSYYLWCQAITSKHISAADKAQVKTLHEEFTALMDNEWPSEVGGVADSSLKALKRTKKEFLPDPSDVQVFFKHMDNKISNLMKILKSSLDIQKYQLLNQAVIAYLIAFSGRRPSEVIYSTVEDYKELVYDTHSSMAVFIVNAPKTNSTVPVLVPEITQEAIAVLLNLRKMFNVTGDLLFPKPDGTAYSNSVLSKFTSEVTLKKRIFFTANGMRHYWATHLQDRPELKSHLPKFQGHTTQVHEKIYEMNLPSIYLKLFGPALLATTHGNGMECEPGISEQQDEEILQSKENSKILKKVAEIQRVKSEKRKLTEPNTKTNNKNMKSVLQDLPTCTNTCANENHKYKVLRTPKKTIYRNNSDDENTDDTSKDPHFLGKSDESSTDGSPVTRPSVKWITPEKEELYQNLPLTLLGKKKLERGELRRVWENSTILRKRHTLQMTRIKVSQYYKQKIKIPTPVRKRLIDRADQRS